MNDLSLIMWTALEIAKRDGTSRQAVSKQIKVLVEARPDTPVELDSRGRVLKVSLADYDEYRGRFANPARVTAPLRPSTSPPPPSVDPTDSFDEARRQTEWMKLRREKIRHLEEIGALLRRDKLREAIDVSGNEIKTVVARLPNRAEDVTQAVSREGIHGARAALRTIAFELGNEIADRLEQLSAEAPETDPLIDDDAYGKDV